jgi:diaminohydroxyphosphoribosylaminopyrimidine deaminase/5-amino-6-(5-phosphoribosylamino)uracil reductase
MVGIGTVMSDDPLLTCRVPGMERRSPVRVVLDPRLRLPLTSALARTAEAVRTWVIAGPDAPRAAEQTLQWRGVKVFRSDGEDGRLDLAAVMRLLATEGITRVMVEGGPRIAAALVSTELVDEAVLLRSPKSIGVEGIDALDRLPLTALTQSPLLKSHTSETIGEDIVETYERA